MDVEDEDEEGADSQNASADQEGLEATMSSQGQGEEENLEAEGGAGEQEEGEGVFQKSEEHLESEEALDSWEAISNKLIYSFLFFCYLRFAVIVVVFHSICKKNK